MHKKNVKVAQGITTINDSMIELLDTHSDVADDEKVFYAVLDFSNCAFMYLQKADSPKKISTYLRGKIVKDLSISYAKVQSAIEYAEAELLLSTVDPVKLAEAEASFEAANKR